MPPSRVTAVLQVIGAAALWGISGVVARSLFQRAVDPVHLVQVRMMLGGLALLPLAVRGGMGVAPRWLALLPPYAVALAAVQLTYFEAVAAAGVAVAVFLQYTSPLLVAGFEAARDRRLPPRPVLLSLGAATAGSALLVLPGGALRVPAGGLAWGIASAFSMAAGTILAGSAQRRGARPLPLLSLGLALGSLLFWPVRTPWAALASVSPGDWPFFLFIGLFATAVPFGLYVAALGRLRGSVVNLVAMLEPALAGALAWIALGESLTRGQVAGAALILAGVALAVAGSRRG
ncbi:MAG TPA: DMT family transporter [Anaeromyxobacteraceae bacterium]|nr:DMT family transporter [Anaeromyxobacteraceae bacterium]